MATIELEPTVRDWVGDDTDRADNRDPAHLYYVGLLDATTTICGLPSSKDPHNRKHHPSVKCDWEKGMMSCPKCGWPLCMDCLLAVT